VADIRHDSFFRKGNNCSEGGKYSGANVKSRIALTSRATFAFQIRDSPGVVTADVAVVSPSCRVAVASLPRRVAVVSPLRRVAVTSLSRCRRLCVVSDRRRVAVASPSQKSTSLRNVRLKRIRRVILAPFDRPPVVCNFDVAFTRSSPSPA